MAPPLKLAEDDVETVVIQTLRRAGYDLWKIGGKRPVYKLAQAVGQFILKHLGRTLTPPQQQILRVTISTALEGRFGNDVGAPDLLIRHVDWPTHVLFGLEVKGPTTQVRPEQEKFSSQGAYALGRGIEACLEAVMHFESTQIAAEALSVQKRHKLMASVAEQYT